MCTSRDRTSRVRTVCMGVQRITPSTGVIARAHTSLLISSGPISILSPNLSNPYTDRPMDIVMHMTRLLSSTCLMRIRAGRPTLAFFHPSSLLLPCDICCCSAFERHQDISKQNYQDRQRAPLIIKEAYVRESGHDEAEMLQRLHSTGTLQGCLRAIELEPGPSARTPHWPE